MPYTNIVIQIQIAQTSQFSTVSRFCLCTDLLERFFQGAFFNLIYILAANKSLLLHRDSTSSPFFPRWLVMNSHVPLQLIRTREFLAAPRVRACERPFARMRSDLRSSVNICALFSAFLGGAMTYVFGQVGRFYKTPVALC